MNLAELIINTIKEEAAITRQEIISYLKKNEGKTFLEDEINISSSQLDMTLIAKKNEPSNRKLCQFANTELRARYKVPNKTYQDEDMDAWVKNNHKVCTTIVSGYRSGKSIREICRLVEKECGKGKNTYTNGNVSSIANILRERGYIEGYQAQMRATDKLRELRP